MKEIVMMKITAEEFCKERCKKGADCETCPVNGFKQIDGEITPDTVLPQDQPATPKGG